MCESMMIMSILWATAHHFAQEDPQRSIRQKKRIYEGTIAGLVFVSIFILPILILKYGFGKDFTGQKLRPLMLGGYEMLMVILFTWVGFQLLFMYDDGVGQYGKDSAGSSNGTNTNKNHNTMEDGKYFSKNFEMKNMNSSEKKQYKKFDDGELQKPKAARVKLEKSQDQDDTDSSGSGPKTDHDILNSKTMEVLFPNEKRGLTYMHVISSWVSYFVFLESYLYVMRFPSSEAKNMVLPAMLSFVLSLAFGYLLTILMKNIQLTKLFGISFFVILTSSYHLMYRAIIQFIIFGTDYHSSAASSSPEDEVDKSRWTMTQIHTVAGYTALSYWLIVAILALVHYKYNSKKLKA